MKRILFILIALLPLITHARLGSGRISATSNMYVGLRFDVLSDQLGDLLEIEVTVTDTNNNSHYVKNLKGTLKTVDNGVLQLASSIEGETVSFCFTVPTKDLNSTECLVSYLYPMGASRVKGGFVLEVDLLSFLTEDGQKTDY